MAAILNGFRCDFYFDISTALVRLADGMRLAQVGRDVAHRPGNVLVLLTDRGDVVQRAPGRVVPLEPGEDPPGEVVRGQAAAGRRDVALGEEGLVEHLDAGLYHPGLAGQVGAGRNA